LYSLQKANSQTDGVQWCIDYITSQTLIDAHILARNFCSGNVFSATSFCFGKEGIVKLCIKFLAQMKKMVYA
jgi:hypothetical protein